MATENNKRIAKNTMWLYLRMFISMSLSLYTSRVILQTLGIENYGIYNIVGGVVGMFSFLNATMSSATSRFLTFELGKGDKEKLNDTFTSSFWVHVIIGVIIVLLLETIGLWFLCNRMVIPEDREIAAHIVFQLSVISTFISITQTPYSATLIAHEKMDVYAYVEMVNIFLRLAVLYILVVVNVDKLILYGFLLFGVSTGMIVFYRWYCYSHFKECRIKAKWNPEIVKPMLKFSGWDLYGNMSVTARTQGVSMLLNVFFGPVMNAAAGIAASVQGAVVAFATNITTAVRPQIIKYYALGQYDEMSSLIYNASRGIFLILVLLIMPICMEIDYILKIWLVEFPDTTPIFCILTLCFSLFANMSLIVAAGIHAYGNIIRPSLINGTLYLLVIPVSYIMFSIGFDAWSSFLFNCIAVFIGMMSNVYTLHKYVSQFSIKFFIIKVLIRCLLVVAVDYVLLRFVIERIESSFLRLVVVGLTSTFILGVLGWFFLMNKGTRIMVINYVKRKVCRKV